MAPTPAPPARHPPLQVAAHHERVHLHRAHPRPSSAAHRRARPVPSLPQPPTPLFGRRCARQKSPRLSPDDLDVYSAPLNLKETPLTYAVNLSARLGNEIWIKREDLQPVFSFKIRGAYNMMASLSDDEKKKGVITCSAGNHAQGVALSGHALGIPAVVVMPVSTPSIKWRNVQRLGATVLLHGRDFDEAKAECLRLENEKGLTFVPPYDNPYVVAGQGTVAMEICRQVTDADQIDGIFAAVGGGGLAAGIAAYMKRVAKPTVGIYGVETVDGDAMARSLDAGKRILLDEVGPFADGTAVRLVGEEPFRVCKHFLDDVVLVNNDEICAAIKDVFEETRSVPEPSGALALAGLKAHIIRNNLQGAGKRFVAVISGGNMNFGRLRFVAERADVGERREVLMSIRIPEKPGRLHGIEAVDLSEDEFAKSHVRHLVGGRSAVEHERIFRFEFPERPGALGNFLKGMKVEWNISMFHYRNHGADVGKVLIGVQVPSQDYPAFDEFLETLGYPYVEETNNEVYTMFLRS
ncbi:threonine ammonia-lyase, biosynthetic [Cryptococcus gattii]